MKQSFVVLALSIILTLPAFSQSKEQREAAKQWPLTLRVTPGKSDSKMSKSKGNNNNNGRNSTQTKTQEKTLHWIAKIDCRSTNFTEKVEIKSYHIGTNDGEFAVIGDDTQPVKFDEKGRATVEITSPTARLVTTKKRTGGGRRGGGVQKDVKGERINGLVAQLCVNGTIVKTFVSQPAWAKGAWKPDLTADDLRPGAQNKK